METKVTNRQHKTYAMSVSSVKAFWTLALLCLLSSSVVAQLDPTGFVAARRLNAGSLHSIVLVAFLRPRSPIPDSEAVTAELYSTFKQWQPRLTSSDYDIVIMQTTTEDNKSTHPASAWVG